MKKNLFYSLVLICFCFISYGQLIINTNTTWTANQVLTQSVIIQQGSTLTINPGVQVQVLFIDNNSDLIGDVKIEVKGSLNVLGDPCNKVNFIPYITTTNKQYWSGIELDTLAINCSISNASIQNANIGIKIENTNASINGVEILNSKVNGIYAFGSNANVSVNNSIIRASDGEGLSISNASALNINNSKFKLNGSSGLNVISVQNVNIANSVIYNNSKSGIFLNSSTATISNSVIRKNTRMGVIVSSTNLTCNTSDIDSNSVDGMFVGGSSILTMTNTTLSNNIGFGIETSEYIFNTDFGNIVITGSSPFINATNSNFINNQNTSIVISSLQITNMQPVTPYRIGFGNSNGCGGYDGCNNTGSIPWDENCNNQSLTPSPTSAWHTYNTFHIPFGFFTGFSGSIGVNAQINAWNYRPKYGISDVSTPQTPFWEWSYNATNTYNPLTAYYNNCYPIGVGTFTLSDKIGFMAACGGQPQSNCGYQTSDNASYSIGEFYFKFGGYNYRSLVNSTSVTDILTGNYWDTIVPNAVTNSVGAMLNLNGFVISEILSAHSNLTNSFINSNTTNFQILQNTPLFCSGETNILIAPYGNYNYQWTNNGVPITNNNDSLTVISNGNYAVSLSGACVANSSTISIVISSGNPITITPSGPTSFCAGNSVTLTSPSATGNFWSNGSVSQSISVNNSGSYSLTVSNPQVCPSVSSPIQVIVNPLPTPPVISSSGSTTVCQNGVVVLSSNLSSNLIWSNTTTTQTIIVSSSGTYSAQITSNGCTSLPSNTIQVNVIANPNTTVTPSGPASFCQGNSVSLNAILESGNSYQWYNNGLLIPSATTNVYNATTNGNYTVFISNSNCSSTSAPLFVTVTAIPVAPIISAIGNTTICQGGNVTLNANLSNVVWSNNASTPSITVNQSGSFIAITINNGCASPPSNQISVVVNPLPQIPIISATGPTTFCSGTSVILNSSSSIGNSWSNNQTIPSITVSNSGNYTVTVTDFNGCSSLSLPISVIVNSTPATPEISASGPTTICSEGSLTLLSNSPNGNLWSNGSSSQSNIVTTSGTYFVTVTENGCTSLASNSIPVTVNITPPPPIISVDGPTTFCSGNSVVLTSSSPDGNIWSNGQISQSITAVDSGDYSLQVSNNGCLSYSETIMISVIPVPSPPIINASGPTTFCQGSNVTLTTDSPDGLVWTVSNGNQFPVETLIIQSNQTAIYATVTSNGCTSEPSQIISTTVLPNVTPSFSQVAPICAGSTFILPSTSNNGYSGSWTPAINNTTTTTYTFNPVSGVCATFQTMTVAVNSLPQVTLSTFPNVCNTATNLVLSGGTPLGGTYTGTSVMSNTFNPSIGIGTYPITYTYTNGSGCSSSANQNLTVITCTSEILDLSNQFIHIYPNPISDILYINSEVELFSSFELIDNQGRIVLSDKLKGTKTSFNIESLAPGNYYLKIEEKNILLKVVKQ
jgi:hypothetical protein